MIRRKYQTEDDQQCIRQFLHETFFLNGRQEINWPVYRWDYWIWHINANIFHYDLSAAIFLWQNDRDQLMGVLNPDGPGEAILHVHPLFRTVDLEVEMMTTAETQYAITQPDGQQKLTIWCPEDDLVRRDILTRRGYTRQNFPEYQRRRYSSQPVASVPAPPGYTLRAQAGEEELPARSWASWKAFHPAEPDSKYQGWEWYRSVTHAPLYRKDLDLVAVAPNGEVAAFCTLWYDPETSTAAFEPVGTHPDHQRRGLARALMSEGLRRVHRLGANLVTVGSYSETAGALYASVGFSEYSLSFPWTKMW